MSSREIVNHLLVNDGLARDMDEATDQQTKMTATEVREYVYGKTVDELFSMFANTGFGTINVPTIFGDGYVLPIGPIEGILTDQQRHNRVPMILGSNRDEPSRFMAQDPANVETYLWIFRRLRDEDRYLRAVRYGALAWKERGVDRLAKYLTEAGNRHVYTYRFDWDEEGHEMGLDLSKALGAGHALEIAFVFGNFSDGIGLEYLYEKSDQKDALAKSMMSYWSEFAHNGNPGKGRDGMEVEWLSWGTNRKTSIVLDTPSDRGIYMMEDIVTIASIKNAIASDPEIADQRERCELYVKVFAGSDAFNESEYREFGAGGCSAYPPAGFR